MRIEKTFENFKKKVTRRNLPINTTYKLIDSYYNLVDYEGNIISYTKQTNGLYYNSAGQVIDNKGIVLFENITLSKMSLTF